MREGEIERGRGMVNVHPSCEIKVLWLATHARVSFP